MPADMGGKSPLRDGSNKESIRAEIKQISSLLQFKTCAPALAIAPSNIFNPVQDDSRKSIPRHSSHTRKARINERQSAALFSRLRFIWQSLPKCS
jgi:hypothetical protein